MATKKIKSYSFSEMKDKYIGKVGTRERDEYEYELKVNASLITKNSKTNFTK